MMTLNQVIAELEVPPPIPGGGRGNSPRCGRAALSRAGPAVMTGAEEGQHGNGDGSCTARAGKTRLTDGSFSSCPANSKLTRRDSPSHRGLGRAVVTQNFDAGPPHIARTGMRGVIGGPG